MKNVQLSSFQLILASSFLLLASVSSALAAPTPTPTCKPLYGGGKYDCGSTSLSIDKTVQDSQSGLYVQNLGINDARYSPGSTVAFRIVIKNSGSNAVKNITIKDTFPNYISYTSGDGKYDSNTKTLTINLDSLNGGTTKTYDIKGKVASIENLPQDQSVICLTNQAMVKSNEQSASDNTQFCIQRQAAVGTSYTGTTTSKGGQIVYPVTTNQNITKTPPTGPEAIFLFAFAPLAGVGQFLRKKSSKVI